VLINTGRLLEPDEGEVLVFGRIADSEKERYSADQDGCAVQDVRCCSLNVYETPVSVAQAHGQVETRSGDRHPASGGGGLTSAQQAAERISGGMRKRAGSPCAGDGPKIVFFDEPDSGLDPVRTSLFVRPDPGHAREPQGHYAGHHDIRTPQGVRLRGADLEGQVVHYGEAEEAFAHEDRSSPVLAESPRARHG